MPTSSTELLQKLIPLFANERGTVVPYFKPKKGGPWTQIIADSDLDTGFEVYVFADLATATAFMAGHKAGNITDASDQTYTYDYTGKHGPLVMIYASSNNDGPSEWHDLRDSNDKTTTALSPAIVH